MTTPNKLVLKRGDTLSRRCLHRNSEQEPINLTDYAIRSQIRTAEGSLIGELVISKLDQTTYPGQFDMTATSLITKTWPPGVHICDIQYTNAGNTQSTMTFLFEVLKDVTHD